MRRLLSRLARIMERWSPFRRGCRWYAGVTLVLVLCVVVYHFTINFNKGIIRRKPLPTARVRVVNPVKALKQEAASHRQRQAWTAPVDAMGNKKKSGRRKGDGRTSYVKTDIQQRKNSPVELSADSQGHPYSKIDGKQNGNRNPKSASRNGNDHIAPRGNVDLPQMTVPVQPKDGGRRRDSNQNGGQIYKVSQRKPQGDLYPGQSGARKANKNNQGLPSDGEGRRNPTQNKMESKVGRQSANSLIKDEDGHYLKQNRGESRDLGNTVQSNMEGKGRRPRMRVGAQQHDLENSPIVAAGHRYPKANPAQLQDNMAPFPPQDAVGVHPKSNRRQNYNAAKPINANVARGGNGAQPNAGQQLNNANAVRSLKDRGGPRYIGKQADVNGLQAPDGVTGPKRPLLAGDGRQSKKRSRLNDMNSSIENSPQEGRQRNTADSVGPTIKPADADTRVPARRPGRRRHYREKKYPNDKYHGRCYNPPKKKRVTHPLAAKEIADSLSRKFNISARTLQDITEAVDLNVISINRSDVNNIKIILGYHGYEHTPHYTWYNFTHCEYTNCIPLNPHRTLEHPMAPESVTKAASVILFNLVEMYSGNTLPKIPRRNDQYFGVTSLESTGYRFNLMPKALDGLMNMTLTYHRKSTVPEWHIFKACIDKRQEKISPVNYAEGKTKGALAYVSNCNSVQYNRLHIMRELKKYINVDIFGACGEEDPCRKPGAAEHCAEKLHKQYHFYFSFENSLCEDYISEKFWDRLSEPVYMLPVAMGGLAVQEYTEQTPENSFIHLRNFTSVKELGTYLKYLTENPEAYNAYHRWRESWHVHKRPIYTRFPSCDLCRIANQKPYMPADSNLSSKYNDPSRCANYASFPSSYG